MDGRRHHGFVDGRGGLAALAAPPALVAGQASGVGSMGPTTTPQRLSAAAAAALPPDHSPDDDNDHETFLEQQKREPEGHLSVEIRYGTETSAVPDLSLPCNDSPDADALGPPISNIKPLALHPGRMELAALHPTKQSLTEPAGIDRDRRNHEARRGINSSWPGGSKSGGR